MAAYATLSEAQEYFSNRLHSDLWDASSVENRNKALNTAAMQIAVLNFKEQPSTDDAPEAVKIANFEIAFELLDGRDAQKELENLSIVSRGFSSVRDTNDRSFVQEHLNAGIVSALAWKYLRPLLRDPSKITICRV